MYKYFPVIIFLLYLIGMTVFMISQGIGIAPDRYFIVLVLGSLFIKKTRQFLLDWLPFLFILLAYDFLRGFADNVSATSIHYKEMIDADLFMFNGTLPVNYLQNIFYKPGIVNWYDYFFTIMYFLHFALPLGFGFLLWTQNKIRFRQFTIALLILSYAAWITYVVFPAAPPWMAQRDGYIHGISKIMNHMFGLFPTKMNVPTIYQKFNPNDVAAMPSMHASYPFLVFLFCIKYFKKKGLLFVPYLAAIWFALIYLGEHYVIDEIVGVIYALLVFFSVDAIFTHRIFLRNKIEIYSKAINKKVKHLFKQFRLA